MSKKKHKLRGFAAILLLVGGIALVKTGGCAGLDITKVIETVTPDTSTPTPKVTGEVTPGFDVTSTPSITSAPTQDWIRPDDKVYNGLSAKDLLITGQTEKYSCDITGEPYEVRVFDTYEHIIHVFVAQGESYTATQDELFEAYETAAGLQYSTLEGGYCTWLNKYPVITMANENGEFINMGFEYCSDDPTLTELEMNWLQDLYGSDTYQKTK